MPTAKPKLTLHLASAGNPDFGQYAPISPPLDVPVKSLKDATKKCHEYIRKWNLGGGNWVGGLVKRDGVPYAKISYNLRVWLPDDEGGTLHPDVPDKVGKAPLFSKTR